MPNARASDKRHCGRCHRRPKATLRRLQSRRRDHASEGIAGRPVRIDDGIHRPRRHTYGLDAFPAAKVGHMRARPTRRAYVRMPSTCWRVPRPWRPWPAFSISARNTCGPPLRQRPRRQPDLARDKVEGECAASPSWPALTSHEYVIYAASISRRHSFASRPPAKACERTVFADHAMAWRPPWRSDYFPFAAPTARKARGLPIELAIWP